MTEEQDEAPVTVILIHGAWQGAWVWDRFAPLLHSAGFNPLAVDLPGNGQDQTPPEQVTLDLYVQHVATLIDGLQGPVFVVAHSGGGVVASQLAETLPQRIAGLIYVAGMMLPDAISYGDLVREALPDRPDSAGISPHLIWSEDGLTSRVPAEAAVSHFLSDLPREQALSAAGRLTPQPEGGRAMRPRISAQRFGRVPRLYVEATEDRSVFLHLQRRMQDLVPGAAVVSLHTGHAPHVSAPEALLEAILPFLRACADGSRRP